MKGMTTIPVSRRTKERLDAALLRLQAELGRRLTYDEGISLLISQGAGSRDAIIGAFGLVATELAPRAREVLAEVRQEEERFIRKATERGG